MSIQNELGEFTPVPHALAMELGAICALVYGAIWRRCQMKDGVCSASFATIARDVNLGRTTVHDCIKKLCERGYVVDQTPSINNAPHKYKTVRLVNTNCSPHEQFDQNCSASEHQLFATRTNCSPHEQTVRLPYTSKNKNKNNKSQYIEPGPLSQALLGICQLDWNYVKTDEKLRNAFFGILKFLDSSNVIPSELKKFEEWRVANHWTGKNAPTLKQVGELWGQYKQNGNGSSVVKIGAK